MSFIFEHLQIFHSIIRGLSKDKCHVILVLISLQNDVFGVFILLKFAVESRYDLLNKRNQVNIPQPKLHVHLTGRRLWLLHCEQPEVQA